MKRIRSLRTIFLCLAAALCLGCPACASSGHGEPEDTQAEEQDALEIWTFYDRNVPGYYYMFLWDDIAAEYGVSVDVKNYSSDEMENRLSLALVTGELPDIFMTAGGTFPDDFIEAGVCAPVDAYLSGVSLSEDYAVPYADGLHYTIPCMLNDYGVVFYDKILLDRIGLEIPKTWDDLEAFVRAVNAYNRENGTAYAPISFGEKDGYEGMLLFDMISASDEANASGQTDADGEELTIGRETFRTAAEKIIRLNEIGAFSEDYMETGDEEAVTNFIHHKSVMLVNHSAILSHLMWNMGENFYTGIFPGSYTEDGFYHMVRLNDGMPSGLCINASFENRDLAGKICMEYFQRVNAENVKAGCKSMLAEDDGKAERPAARRLEMNSLTDSAAGRVTAPTASMPQDTKNTVKALIKDLYGGRSDTEQFLAEAQALLQ